MIDLAPIQSRTIETTLFAIGVVMSTYGYVNHLALKGRGFPFLRRDLQTLAGK